MSGCDGRRHSLRYEVFPFTRDAVIEWPTVHRGKLRREVAMARWAGRSPFQCVRMPRIAFRRGFAGKNTDKEVQQENQLSRTQDEGGHGNENVHHLLRLKKHVLGRIINTTHLTADSNNVHWEENAIGADEREPEMNLSECGVHETAEHLWEPEVQTGKCCEQRSDGHDEVEMCNDEVRILELDIRSRCSQKDTAQSTAHKHRYET